MKLRNPFRTRRLASGLVLWLLVLGACGEPDLAGPTGLPTEEVGLAEPVHESAQELAARELASHAIDAQSPEMQKRFYQAHLMTQQHNLTVAQQLVENLSQAHAKTLIAADRSDLAEQLKEARSMVEKRQRRIRELQAKLARL